MNLHDIKTELYRRKIKPAQIADVARVSPVTVRSILNGHGTSRSIQQAIAELLGAPYETLWGDMSDRHESIVSNTKGGVNV